MATRESRDLTALCGVRLLPDDFARGTELARARGLTLPALLRSMLLDAFDEAEDRPHVYLSTACLHAVEEGREYLHRKCQEDTLRHDGTHKVAGQCKWCTARCTCPCHQEGS